MRAFIGSGSEDIGANIRAEQSAIRAERSAYEWRLKRDNLIHAAIVHFMACEHFHHTADLLAYVNALTHPAIPEVTSALELEALRADILSELSPLATGKILPANVQSAA